MAASKELDEARIADQRAKKAEAELVAGRKNPLMNAKQLEELQKKATELRAVAEKERVEAEEAREVAIRERQEAEDAERDAQRELEEAIDAAGDLELAQKPNPNPSQ